MSGGFANRRCDLGLTKVTNNESKVHVLVTRWLPFSFTIDTTQENVNHNASITVPTLNLPPPSHIGCATRYCTGLKLATQQCELGLTK